ncbi:MAG: hypothetical protein ACLQJ7_06685, partial [Syntrophobacteraceae bacterium]
MSLQTEDGRLSRITENGTYDLLYQFAFKIELIEKSGEVTSPHPARFGRSAPAAVAQHLLGGGRS